jgi:menaquinone-dependent protoporphyrinogen oxidase
MTRVLVTAASKHGATAEIAEAIAEVLAGNGLDPAVVPPDEVDDVAAYDAVVLGSAVYAGHWLKPARAWPTAAPRPCGPARQLSFPERAIVSALHVPEGDFRDWPEIRRWATEIATAAADARR